MPNFSCCGFQLRFIFSVRTQKLPGGCESKVSIKFHPKDHSITPGAIVQREQLISETLSWGTTLTQYIKSIPSSCMRYLIVPLLSLKVLRNQATFEVPYSDFWFLGCKDDPSVSAHTVREGSLSVEFQRYPRNKPKTVVLKVKRQQIQALPLRNFIS